MIDLALFNMQFASDKKEQDIGSNGHDVSDDEKVLGVKSSEFESVGHGELPPDPDEHLSAEERARIVYTPSVLLSKKDIH